MTENEMVGWHYLLDEHEFEQLREIVKDREAWPAEVHGVSGVGHDLAAEQHISSVTNVDIRHDIFGKTVIKESTNKERR